MAQADVIVDFLYFQSGLFDAADQVAGIVHFAVAIGHHGEIEADLCQTVRGGLESLSVPEGFHDEQTAVFVHSLGGTAENAGGLFLREAVQELTHPDGIVILRYRGVGIQQVAAVSVNTVGTFHAFGLLSHHLNLLRQVHDGYLHVRIVTHTLGGPAAGVAADIQYLAWI